MSEVTMDNYKRDYGSVLHVNYRHDIEFREKSDELIWRMHTRGTWQADSSPEQVIRYAVELQRARPDRSFRVVTREERELRSEPIHPAAIRSMALHPEAWSWTTTPK